MTLGNDASVQHADGIGSTSHQPDARAQIAPVMLLADWRMKCVRSVFRTALCGTRVRAMVTATTSQCHRGSRWSHSATTDVTERHVEDCHVVSATLEE